MRTQENRVLPSWRPHSDGKDGQETVKPYIKYTIAETIKLKQCNEIETDRKMWSVNGSPHCFHYYSIICSSESQKPSGSHSADKHQGIEFQVEGTAGTKAGGE